MKICTFCGSENDNAAQQCRECCTEEFRLPTLEEVSASAATADSAEPQPEWELLVELPVADAKDLLQRLEASNLQFKLINDEPSAHSDGVTAYHGGKFGRGGAIQIFTRLADKENVQKVWKRFCNFED